MQTLIYKNVQIWWLKMLILNLLLVFMIGLEKVYQICIIMHRNAV